MDTQSYSYIATSANSEPLLLVAIFKVNSKTPFYDYLNIQTHVTNTGVTTKYEIYLSHLNSNIILLGLTERNSLPEAKETQYLYLLLDVYLNEMQNTFTTQIIHCKPNGTAIFCQPDIPLTVNNIIDFNPIGITSVLVIVAEVDDDAYITYNHEQIDNLFQPIKQIEVETYHHIITNDFRDGPDPNHHLYDDRTDRRKLSKQPPPIVPKSTTIVSSRRPAEYQPIKTTYTSKPPAERCIIV